MTIGWSIALRARRGASNSKSCSVVSTTSAWRVYAALFRLNAICSNSRVRIAFSRLLNIRTTGRRSAEPPFAGFRLSDATIASGRFDPVDDPDHKYVELRASRRRIHSCALPPIGWRGSAKSFGRLLHNAATARDPPLRLEIARFVRPPASGRRLPAGRTLLAAWDRDSAIPRGAASPHRTRERTPP
jgi:hypothetical protein